VLNYPIWLKIKRAGAVLSFQRSENGTSYTEVATREIGTSTTQVTLPDEVLVGLAVTAGGGGAARYDFREVSPPAFTEVIPQTNWTRCDCNGDGLLDISDPVYSLSRQFQGGEELCDPACNCNADDVYDISDPIFDLARQFQGGASPPPPFPACQKFEGSRCEELRRDYCPGGI
jgi:hypothetical protein